MANITDPLAASLHGTDPQNLLEYITRQKIYDSRYWKEECFGLSAVDVLEKSATSLRCVGGTYGGNRQPTHFLALVLKLLQIQPDEELVDDLIAQEDFVYTRALGAFYKRLTGRPADIYQTLEPLYNDYRKLRFRDVDEWKLVYVDEFVHLLLTSDRVCGIALPRLPRRQVLEEEGYLDNDNGRGTGRTSALSSLLQEQNMTPHEYLLQKVQDGSAAARALYESRQTQTTQQQAQDDDDDERSMQQQSTSLDYSSSHNNPNIKGGGGNTIYGKNGGGRFKRRGGTSDEAAASRPKRSKGNVEATKNYGNLFKNGGAGVSNKFAATTVAAATPTVSSSGGGDNHGRPQPPEEGSDEYWNEQRAQLGLKPLKK